MQITWTGVGQTDDDGHASPSVGPGPLEAAPEKLQSTQKREWTAAENLSNSVLAAKRTVCFIFLVVVIFNIDKRFKSTIMTETNILFSPKRKSKKSHP